MQEIKMPSDEGIFIKIFQFNLFTNAQILTASQMHGLPFRGTGG